MIMYHYKEEEGGKSRKDANYDVLLSRFSSSSCGSILLEALLAPHSHHDERGARSAWSSLSMSCCILFISSSCGCLLASGRGAPPPLAAPAAISLAGEAALGPPEGTSLWPLPRSSPEAGNCPHFLHTHMTRWPLHTRDRSPLARAPPRVRISGTRQQGALTPRRQAGPWGCCSPVVLCISAAEEAFELALCTCLRAPQRLSVCRTVKVPSQRH